MTSAPPPPFLTAVLRHRLGAITIDVAFDLRHPWTILFGPSGSGKTTILRALSGLLHPDHASIVLRLPEPVTLVDHPARVFLPPHRRPVRAATQAARLFPNLTVRANLLYGAGASPTPIHTALADELLTLFRIESLARSSPRQLSGGEQQRASVARAVLAAAAAPALLLLDEPFTGLDSAARDTLLADLQRWLAARRIPVLSVTHDIAEALQLNTEVLRLHDGRILHQGPAAQVLAEERTRLLAQLHTAPPAAKAPSS